MSEIGLGHFDLINRMKTLTLITLSGFRCSKTNVVLFQDREMSPGGGSLKHKVLADVVATILTPSVEQSSLK